MTKEDLHETIMKATNGDGIPRICEISGHAPTLSKCLKYMRKGGKLGLVGLPKSAVTFEDPLPDLIFKSLEIHSVHGRKIFHTWEECEKLIESGKVQPGLSSLSSSSSNLNRNDCLSSSPFVRFQNRLRCPVVRQSLQDHHGSTKLEFHEYEKVHF